MTFYIHLQTAACDLYDDARPNTKKAANIVPVTTEQPDDDHQTPSPWMMVKNSDQLNILDLDNTDDRAKMAAIIDDIPLYRMLMELQIDNILFESRDNVERRAGTKAAFSPEETPEPINDPMSDKYAFAGNLRYPGIASRTSLQLLELYLRLFGSATPDRKGAGDHLKIILGDTSERLLDHCDGIIWRGVGWARMDKMIYDCERLDFDPEITFESYVTRGRNAACAIKIDSASQQLAAWIQAERVQAELCRDIDSILTLSDIRKLPRWVRSDVFRILEREAMKQVFAENLLRVMEDWPALRRSRLLAEPIQENGKGEVSSLVQQILNQTLSVDGQYSGSAGAFAMQAGRRKSEADKLIAEITP